MVVGEDNWFGGEWWQRQLEGDGDGWNAMGRVQESTLNVAVAIGGGGMRRISKTGVCANQRNWGYAVRAKLQTLVHDSILDVVAAIGGGGIKCGLWLWYRRV